MTTTSTEITMASDAKPSPVIGTEDERKLCPFCASSIPKVATKCYVCKERLKPPSAWSSLARWLVEDGKGLFVLLGLAIYAIVRVALDSFYGAFRVTPEEVGLTQTVI